MIPTRPLNTYTVYLTPTNTVQVQSVASPTVDSNRMLTFDPGAAQFSGWMGWVAASAVPATAPAPTSGGGLFGWLTGK